MNENQPEGGFAKLHGLIAALIVLVAGGSAWLLAAELRIKDLKVDLAGKVSVAYETDSPGEIVLLRGDTVTNVQTRVSSVNAATAGDGQIQDPNVEVRPQSFYRVQNVPGLTTLASSPADGETGVAVTRETILRFNQPLAEGVTLGNDLLWAEFGGRRLLSRVEVSTDRRTVTLFYLENLPSSARIAVTLEARQLPDWRGQLVDADGDGQPGGVGHIVFETLSITPVAGTAIMGRVFASELAVGGTVNKPLEGVTITVDGAEETLRTTTDAMGNFRLDPCPAGRFFVHVDGRTAKGSQWPGGAYYPFVGKAWEAAPGRQDNLAGGNGEIYLPLIQAEALQPVSATENTVITFPDTVIAANPSLAGVSITVPANSLFADNGTRGGRVGIAPVPPDRLPEPLPTGLEFPLVFTVQSDGPLNFDQPVPACFPNLPDPGTGQPLPPGTQNWLYSFNHDKGIWEAVGSMTVSSNGKLVCTDSGVGILQPGWHASGPPPTSPGPPGCTPPQGRSFSLSSLRPSGPDCADYKREECIQDFNDCGLQTGPAAAFICASTCGGYGLSCGPLAPWCVGGGIFTCGTACFIGNLWRCNKNFASCMRQAALLPPCVEPPPVCVIPRRMLADSRTQNSLKPILHAPASDIWDVISEEDFSAIGDRLELAFSLGSRSFLEERELTQEEARIANQAFVEADAIAKGRLVELLDQIGNIRDQVMGPNRISPGNAPNYPIHYFAFARTSSGDPLEIRGMTRVHGEYELFLPRTSRLFGVFFFDPLSFQAGVVTPFHRPENQNILPRVELFRSNEMPDIDGDGLPDIAEKVLGTSAINPDSDGDGIPDGAEIRNGTNPLDGRPAVTGVIASAPTPGTAVDVCVSNDRAITAEREAGVSIFNVFNAMEPVLVGRVDTPGSATAVACSGNLLAVADGDAGLQIIDLTSPAAAGIVRRLGLVHEGFAQAVAMLDRFVFVGTRAGVFKMVEAETGVVRQSLQYAGAVDDIVTHGGRVFVLANSVLHSLSIEHGFLEPLHSVTVTRQPADGFAVNRRRVTAGNGHAYIANFSGYDVVDISRPEALRLVGSARSLGPNAFKFIADNGNGLGIAAVGVNPRDDGTHNIHLFDLTDPAQTDRFLTVLPTPGIAHAAALHNGLAYVADGAQGLQVVNYLAYDNKRLAPTGTLEILGTGLVTATASSSFTAGGLLVMQASVRDDVQVRNVEFLADGALLGTDGGSPFELAWRPPANLIGRTIELSARVTDTGGNSTNLPPRRVSIVADTLPPLVQLDAPPEALQRNVGDMLRFDLRTGDNVELSEVRFLVNGQPVPGYRSEAGYAEVPVPSGPGTHLLQVIAADRSGNTTTRALSFRVRLEAVSREFSLFNFGPSSTAKPEAISREFSLFNFGPSPTEKPEAISREFSIENKKPAATARTLRSGEALPAPSK